MKIRRYELADEEAVISAIKEDPAWDIFTDGSAIGNYRKSLSKSITYVCYDDDDFCGYLRALLDVGFAIYISELYVVPEWRRRMIGRALVAQVKKDYESLAVYALSDEDAYYEKLGYEKIGSVFEIHS